VVPFASAEPAVKHIQEKPQDLAIFDVNLPGASGLDACEILRKNPETAWLPLLILTAFPNAEHVNRAIGLNVNGFVAKPYEPAQLVEKVFALIGMGE
jgi:CheY-like chemotaxis protein